MACRLSAELGASDGPGSLRVNMLDALYNMKRLDAAGDDSRDEQGLCITADAVNHAAGEAGGCCQV